MAQAGGQIVEHLGVGESASGRRSSRAGTRIRSTPRPRPSSRRLRSGCPRCPVHAVAGAADPAELLDVDVDELARDGGARSGWAAQAAPAASACQPDPLQPERHRRERQTRAPRRSRPPSSAAAEAPRSPQPAPAASRLGSAAAATSDRAAPVAIPIPAEPLRGRPLAATRRLGRLPQRPPLLKHPPTDQQTAARTGPMISVKLHPVTSSGAGGFDTPSLQEARMNNVLRNYSALGPGSDGGGPARWLPGTRASRAPLGRAGTADRRSSCDRRRRCEREGCRSARTALLPVRRPETRSASSRTRPRAAHSREASSPDARSPFAGSAGSRGASARARRHAGCRPHAAGAGGCATVPRRRRCSRAPRSFAGRGAPT